jgi:integrase/recombinase XerD
VTRLPTSFGRVFKEKAIMRKPFYRSDRKKWFVVGADGKFIPLHEDEEEAYLIWNRMLEQSRRPGDPRLQVMALASRFLKEQEVLLKPDRFKHLDNYVSAFSAALGEKPCSAITKGTVVAWVNKKESWGDYAKRDAIASVKQMFKWGLAEKHISDNPVATLVNPKPEPRDRVMSDAEHAWLIAAARCQKENGKEFALVLMASRCGVRPQQIREVTGANVVGCTWVFKKHKTRGKTKKPLVVFLPPCLATLTRMLVRKYPTGPLFRQESGRPWSKDTIARRLLRLRRKLGISDDVIMYAYRHTYATNAMMAGLSTAEVATLLGHTDTRMVTEVYGHLDQNNQHMLGAAARSYKRAE